MARGQKTNIFDLPYWNALITRWAKWVFSMHIQTHTPRKASLASTLLPFLKFIFN